MNKPPERITGNPISKDKLSQRGDLTVGPNSASRGGSISGNRQASQGPETKNQEQAKSKTGWEYVSFDQFDNNQNQSAKTLRRLEHTRASEIAKNREKRERVRKRKIGQAAIAGVMVLVVAASGVISSRTNKKDKDASVEHPTEAGDSFEGQTSEDILSTLAETEKETSENSVEAREFSKELISPEEACDNIKNFIASGEYLNVEGDCVAENISDICLKNNIPLAQTVALIANSANESNFCPLQIQQGVTNITKQGYALFQFTGALRKGTKGEVYIPPYPCQTDGYEVYLQKNYPECTEFSERYIDAFNAYGYDIDNQKMAALVNAMPEEDQKLYKKTIAAQMEFLFYAMTGNYLKKQTTGFMNSTDYITATDQFVRKYEVPGDMDYEAEKRIQNAAKIYERIKANPNHPDLSDITRMN